MSAADAFRNDAVRAVLLTASMPLGPTEIARRINQEWCCHEVGQHFGIYPHSLAIFPILHCIGAVGVDGKYTLPK